MERILFVEDNKAIAKLFTHLLEDEFNIQLDVASTYKSALAKLEDNHDSYFLIISGLVLPDASNGEMVSYCQEHGLPVIVLTSTYSEETRKDIMQKSVFDYIIKRDQGYVEMLLRSIRRAVNNRKTTVALVDDSSVFRKLMHEILSTQLFDIIETDNAKEILKLLKKREDIKLLISDYDMPEMDGADLTTELRKFRTIDALSILIVSGQSDEEVIPRVLKLGANDYIKKPFNKEEFITRVNLNLENLEMIEYIRNVAHLDIPTGLFSKRYFYDLGRVLHSNASRTEYRFSVALIQADNIDAIKNELTDKQYNELIKSLAKFMDRYLKRKSDVAARFGPARFAIITDVHDPDDLYSFYDNLRVKCENETFQVGSKEIKITLSIGVAFNPGESFESMVERAQNVLSESIKRGENRVWLD